MLVAKSLRTVKDHMHTHTRPDLRATNFGRRAAMSLPIKLDVHILTQVLICPEVIGMSRSP